MCRSFPAECPDWQNWKAFGELCKLLDLGHQSSGTCTLGTEKFVFEICMNAFPEERPKLTKILFQQN